VNIVLVGFERDYQAEVALKWFSENDEIKELAWVSNYIPRTLKTVADNIRVLDFGAFWFGSYPDNFSDNRPATSPRMVSLLRREMEHLAYAYCRTTFFANPRILASKPDFQNKVHLDFEKALRFLKNMGADLMISDLIPHSYGSLLLHYAAKYLHIVHVTNYWIGFADFHFVTTNISEPCRPESYKFTRNKAKNSTTADISEKHFLTEGVEFLNKRSMIRPYETPQWVENTFNSEKEALHYGSKMDRLRRRLMFQRRSLFFLFKKTFQIPTPLIWAMEKIATFLFRFFQKAFRSYVKLFSKEGFKKGPYILFCLQTQPELSTSPISKDAPFETSRAIELAKKFPNHKIILKEHPVNFTHYGDLLQYRSFDFIKALKRYKNLSYLTGCTNVEYQSLVLNADFVVTTSGTIAYEAYGIGTPVCIFSSHPSNGLPWIVECASVEDIDITQLKKIRKTNCSQRPLENTINDWLRSLHQRPHFQGCISGWSDKNYNIDELKATFAEYIEMALVIHHEKKG
jgi:hypothetical protein